MSDVRLIEAPLDIGFEIENVNSVEFEREYIQLSEADNDAIAQWLRNAKGKGEMGDSDGIVVQLLVELYRKIDRLEQALLHTAPKRIPLSNNAKIGRIGYEYFELLEPQLVSGTYYYGRLEMPVHPMREAGFYFEAQSPTLAKIVRMHQKDINEWGIYMMARERAIIRHLKGYE
ncbi:MAG: hypothetical protein Q8M43_04975 [Sulfuricurvum sp.]|uniref:hypothetical protein n=1 Tax=Sulfuricurvum sp. TaxID=2025608 RepID=UPI002718A319|nr:hypothetical protein [Sulfuricurvum sp.]MDO9054962.1 hypothetical protein [Sulfuricurvum sp.]MDP2849830.1 hypothetical protein [Sulfuricurvum sp.]MDP3291367.1 hypothetical protein [Sulfuricurvum sp.]